MRRGVARVAGLTLALAVRPAALHAEPAKLDEQPLRIQYTAHAGCPDALSFFWHVRARTQRVRLAEPGELAALVSVHIDADGGESVGTLEMPGPESRPFEREVRASSCEEVVLALSLVLALAYDPDALQAFPPPPERPLPAPIPPPLPPREVPAAPSAPERSTWRAAFGLDGLLVGGVVASGLEPAGSVFLEIGRPSGVLSPTLGGSFVFVPKESGVSDADPTARFGYLGARLLLCPVDLAAAPELDLAPCAGLDLGRLTASTGVPAPLPEQTTLWAAGLLLARLRWNFFGRFFGEAFGGMGVTLKSDPRDTFKIRRAGEGETTVFEVPRVVTDLGIGVGAYFP